MGLRVIADRYVSRITGQKCYLLRPASDARRVVQILPDGNYCLASFCEYGRRYAGSQMSFEEVESFLAHCEPMPANSGERRRRTPNFLHASCRSPHTEMGVRCRVQLTTTHPNGQSAARA